MTAPVGLLYVYNDYIHSALNYLARRRTYRGDLPWWGPGNVAHDTALPRLPRSGTTEQYIKEGNTKDTGF